MGVYSIVPKMRRQRRFRLEASWLVDEPTELAIDSADEFIHEET